MKNKIPKYITLKWGEELKYQQNIYVSSGQYKNKMFQSNLLAIG